MHAPDDDREAFHEAAEAHNHRALSALAGRLWNCTDTLPSAYCDELGLPLGSSYAQAARQVR